MNPTHNLAIIDITGAGSEPTPADTPAETLRDAALYLDRHGWTQGEYFANFDDPTPPACPMGAIAIAVYGHTTDVLYPCGVPGHVQVCAAIDVLMAWIAATHDTYRDDLDAYHNGNDNALHGVVADWNDEADRTAAEVIAELRAAAHAWDQTSASTCARTDGGAR